MSVPPFRRVGRRARRWRQCLAARSDATPVRVGALAVDAAAGTVHLAVHLAYDGRFWSMDLTVEGPRGTYVVRDLEAFAHRVQRGEHFSYGKKLAFAHRLEAFDRAFPGRGSQGGGAVSR